MPMRRIDTRFIRRAWIIALIAVAAGCADVTVRKVPTPTQYVHWTDDMQRSADGIEGIRFYLPRPFINVFESFPVRTDIYIATGVVSPDGKYVIITQMRGESTLSNYIASPNGQMAIPMSQVSDPNKVLAAAQAEVQKQNASAPAQTPTTAQVPIGVQGPAAGQPSQPVATNGQIVTGQNRQAASNDNGAFAYQPLRGNFDLVYMPDFEEQYAISSRAGLGNANFQVNLGQGWSLQGYNALSDNSELNKRVFDLIDTSIKLAKAAAQAALGVPLPSLPNAIPGTAIAQAETQVPKETKAGTPVNLKIVVIHYAAKGLYPVIKPRELAERIKSSGTNYCVLDLFKMFPTMEYASDFNPAALKQNQQIIENETSSSTFPRYPYQYVSFNTFKYMAIEVVQPGDPFQVLYDKTGTQGDVGDRQKADLSNRLGGGGTTPPGNTPAPPSQGLSDDDVAKWKSSLESHNPKIRYPAAGATCYDLLSISRTGSVFSVPLQAHGLPPDPGADSKFEGSLLDFLLSSTGGYPAELAVKPGKDATFQWPITADPNAVITRDDLQKWNKSLQQKQPRYPADGTDYYVASGVSSDGFTITVNLSPTGKPTDPAKDSIFAGNLRTFLLSDGGGFPSGATKPASTVQFQWNVAPVAPAPPPGAPGGFGAAPPPPNSPWLKPHFVGGARRRYDAGQAPRNDRLSRPQPAA